MGSGIADADASNVLLGSSDPVERRYRLLLEHSPDPLCVHADGRVVYLNPAAVNGIAAHDAEDVVGRMITDFVHPDSIGPMLGRIAELTQEGDSSPPSEAVMLRLDGSPVDAEVVSVLTSWDGKPAYQVIFRDLTLIKAAQATLRYQAALVTHATDAIIATSMTGTVTSWNRAAETIYRRPAVDALGLPIGEAVGAAVDPAAIVVGGGVQHAMHRAADGTAHTVRVAAAMMDDGYVLVCSDHTALRRAERRFQTVLNSLDEGVVVFDADGQPEWINPAGRHILGLPLEGDPHDSLDQIRAFPLFDVDGKSIEHRERFFVRTVTTGAAVRNVIVGYEGVDGGRRWLSASCRLFDPADAEIPAVLATFTDVTEQHNAQVRLNHQAHHDSLTGLPNRAYVEVRAAEALRAEPPALAAVMFIDLDNVKTINDAHGHYAGDTVITAAAQRLRSALRSEDVIARHGGDEFVALLFGHTDRVALERLADRMHSALATPLDVAGTRCHLTASIGVTAVSADDRRDAAQLLQDADAAMYQAKVHRATTHYA